MPATEFTDLPQREQPDPDICKPPFLIRAHHLERYRILYNNLTKKGGRSEVAVISSTVQEIVGNLKLSERKYAEDILGFKFRDEKRYSERLREIFTRFTTLPPEYPVRIYHTPDAICGSCSIGKHCMKNSIQQRQEIVIDEDRYSKYLLRRLQELPRQGKSLYQINYDDPAKDGLPDYFNSGISILTSARTLRQVFEGMRMHGMTFLNAEFSEFAE